MTFSTISTELVDRVKASWEVNPDYRDTLGQLTQGTSRGRFALKYELFKRDGNIIMGGDNELRMNILRELHASPTGGILGSRQPSNGCPLLYWKGLKRHVWEFVWNCEVCQKHKYDRSATPGLLQPLVVSDGIYLDILMDFIIRGGWSVDV